MRVVERFDSLQLNQQCVLDQQVWKVLADQHAVVDTDARLLHNREAHRTQFLRLRVLIDFFQKPDAKHIEHRERAADHMPRQTSCLPSFRIDNI